MTEPGAPGPSTPEPEPGPDLEAGRDDGQLRFGFRPPRPATSATRVRRRPPRGDDVITLAGQQDIAAAPEPVAVPALRLFDDVLDIDVHLGNGGEAVATVGGDAEWAAHTFAKIVGDVRRIAPRRLGFPATRLDRLLCVTAPHRITLDAASTAVARALWAHALDWKPLHVIRQGRRLLASSRRWPTGWRVQDAPWSAIACLEAIDVPLAVEARAQALLMRKLAESGGHIADAAVAGSAVLLHTNRPDLLEGLQLPALAYAGGRSSGRYRIPLLCADAVLREPTIGVPDDVRRAVEAATARTRAKAAPAGFPRTLYSFQARDLGRALHIVAHTGGVLFAGEMGSGKTTVALALVEHLNCWPLLVVAPLAAFSTWLGQIEELDRRCLLAVGSIDETIEQMAEADCVVVSYDRLHRFGDALEHGGFAAIVADEIQRIRTPGSRRSRALRALAGSVPIRVGLSGTPVTNRAEDVLPIGAFLVPGEWKPRLTARDLAELYPGDDPLESLAEHLGTMMVRRRMADTGVKLPGRTVLRVPVQLSPEQRRALRDLEEEARSAARDGELSSRMHIFARLGKLRQIVNVPAAAGVSGPNAKVSAAVDLAVEYSEAGRKSVIFVADRAAWVEVGEGLAAAGVGWTGIWGSTSPMDRIANERRFHDDPDVRVFVGTLAACGESLTLSPTATVTIFASLSYSPSAIAQAAARTYRMNQTNDVDELYLHAIAPGGTIDDRMTEILETKRRLIAQVVDRTEHVDATETVSIADLLYMVTGEHDAEALARTEARIAAQRIRDADAAASDAEVERRRAHARATLYRRRTGEVLDRGEQALTREELEVLAEEDADDGDWDDDTHLPGGLPDDPDGAADGGEDDGDDDGEVAEAGPSV